MGYGYKYLPYPLLFVPPETTVPIKRATVQRLKQIGHMQETYDQLINRLLDERENDSKQTLKVAA